MRLALTALAVTALAAVAGCGGGSSSPPQAAWSVQMVQSDPQTCNVADNLRQVGSVSGMMIGHTVVDQMVDANMNTISVQCTVSGSGPFAVQASAAEGADNLQISINSISASATMASPAVGSVAYESDATADVPFQGSCNFYFDGQTMGSAPPIAAGRIWVEFQCAALQAQMFMCPIQQGYAVFEDCLTSTQM